MVSSPSGIKVAYIERDEPVRDLCSEFSGWFVIRLQSLPPIFGADGEGSLTEWNKNRLFPPEEEIVLMW